MTTLLVDASSRGRGAKRVSAVVGVDRSLRFGGGRAFVVEAEHQLGRLGLVLARARVERRAFLSILGLPPLGRVLVVPVRRAWRTGEGGACGCLLEVIDLQLAPQAVASCRAASADVCTREGGREASAVGGGT